MHAKRIPVILDTDIGDDIDDTWALALLLKSSELDVKLVSTATGDTTYRARLVARMLEIAGRTDVPVGIGIPNTGNESVRRQAAWVKDYALDRYPGKVHSDGVQAIIDTIMASPEPMTLICIGPLPNIAEALRREPRIAGRTRFVGMHGSVNWRITSNLTLAVVPGPCAEWNVVSDVPAAKAVFSAQWLDATITPLDTCGRVVLDGARYQRLCDSKDPLMRAVLENYRVWAQPVGGQCKPETQSSVLFDCVAVHLAHTTRWLKMKRIGMRVDSEGYTREDAAACPFNVAMEWSDYEAFADDLVSRLTNASDKKALVYKGMHPNSTCCDQALRILPGGEWIVVFMTGGSIEPELANFVALCRSTDQGETWGPMQVVLRREDRACTLTEVLIHNNEIIVFVNIHAGYFDKWMNYTIRSRDNGRTWSEPEPFLPLPRRAFVRNIYQASWGDWIAPFQYFKPVGDPDVSVLKDGSFEKMWIGALVSHDQGLTWTKSQLVQGRCWAENNVVELRDGRLVMLIRADGTGCLWRSESGDQGRTWSDPVRTEIPNPGSKFRLFRLRDGRIAMIHNPNAQTSHPNSKHYAQCTRNPLALWISANDMRTWDYQRMLTDFPGQLAYPDGVVDEQEQYIHFAFDYNRHNVIYFGAALP